MVLAVQEYAFSKVMVTKLGAFQRLKPLRCGLPKGYGRLKVALPMTT